MIRKSLEGQMVDRWHELVQALQEHVDKVNQKHPSSLEMTPNEGLSYTVSQLNGRGAKLRIELLVPHSQSIEYIYLRPANTPGGTVSFDAQSSSVVMILNGEKTEPNALAEHLLKPFFPLA
jgi:hypothetical protein